MSSLKQELIEKISTTENEDLLEIPTADSNYFNGSKDVFDELSESNKEDLICLLNEPFGHETQSYDDFKKATDKWRTK